MKCSPIDENRTGILTVAIILKRYIHMKLSQFKFDLPLNLIAQNPTKRREDSRLMVVDRKSGHMENRNFKDILDYYDGTSHRLNFLNFRHCSNSSPGAG